MAGNEGDETVRNPKGSAMYEKVLGKPAPDKELRGVSELGVNHLFANVWSRPGLSIRDRRLMTLALLAAQGRESQLKDHIRGARLGEDPLSREEILEVMVHVAHYAGWAAGASGQGALDSVLAELGE
jgi:4-carboxymuconolactone decarboxylase